MAQLYDMPLEQLKNYKPPLTKQSDFDEFWERSLKQLADVPVSYRLTPYEYPVRGVKVYQVSFPGFKNANIDGWFAIPEGSGTYPGLVLYHGYNWAFDGNLHDTVNWALKGYASLQMLVRGQQGKSVDNIISSSGFNAGWITKGILSPEEYYYRAVYMDAVRAVEVLAAMPQVDKAYIGLTGGSQAAALSGIPRIAVAEYPGFSNFERAIDITPQGPYFEMIEYFRRNSDPKIEKQAKVTLSYFDIMNLAPRIQCHTWIGIGLVDELVPPSTVFAVYNHLVCPKEISVHRYFGHEYIPATVEPKLQLFMKFLQSQ